MDKRGLKNSSRISCLLSLIFLGLIDFECNAQKAIQGLPLVTNYSPEQYKAGIQNWDIIQDNSGFVYAANNLGLLIFDGISWERYEINNTKVRSIHQGSDNNIYVGSQGGFGYLNSDQSGELVYVSLSDSLPVSERNFDETWKVYEIEDKVYFCTFRGIYIYDKEKIEVIPSSNRLDISFKVNNQLYTFEYDGGLAIVENGRIELIRNGEFFKEKRVSNILNFDRDRLLITTFEYGAFLYDGDIQPFIFKGDFWQDNFLINYSTRLRNGSIALATQNTGLFIINKEGELLLHLDKSSGLLDLTVNYIFEDKSQGLWLAMNYGLARVDLNSPFTFLDDRMGLVGSGYTALKKESKVYLGTNVGLFIYENGQISFIEGSEGQVYTIQEINNSILIGHQNGTYQLVGNNLVQIYDEPGTWVFKSFPDQPNLILQGNYTGLAILEQNGKLIKFRNTIEGFEESSRLIEMDEEVIWVAHGYKGMFKIRLNEEMTEVESAKLYDSRKGFPRDVLINVFKIENRLVFTADAGFYNYNNDQDYFEPSGVYQTLLGDGVTMVDMESDPLGNIYFIERQKLGVLKSLSSNKYELNYDTFNKIRSAWNDDLANVSVLDDQNILFGGKQGFIHYSPSADLPRDEIPEVHFKSIVNRGETDRFLFQGHDIGNNLISNLNGTSFPYGQNSFEFEFVSPHFESGGEVMYQYKLNEFQEDWSEWGYENRREFTNLREGGYEFMVRSKNIFDETSDIAVFSFVIKPPFYRSIFAYIFYFLGTLVTLFVGFKWLDKLYKKETSRLEEQQGLALQKKEKEIKFITQRTEEEIIKLKNDKLQSEVQYKNQELTSSAMNLIQKNQLLSNIKNTLKNISKEERSRPLNSQLTRLIKSIDKDLDGGNEWEQFSDNFDQVHGKFIMRLKEKYPNLTPQEIKFAAYIRMNLNTKEIANLLGISVRGVEIGRYRVRKKLELQRKDNLSDFLLRF